MHAIGVLALQGDFAAHRRCLERLGACVRYVRAPGELCGLAGLVLPGGESTSMRTALADSGLDGEIASFAARRPVLGTCAGAILMSREVRNPHGRGLGLLDICIERNAYGRQLESFEAQVELAGEPGPALAGVFIRAPAIVAHGRSVRVRGRARGAPVWVRQGFHTACTFHPELTRDPRVHSEFLELAREACPT